MRNGQECTYSSLHRMLDWDLGQINYGHTALLKTIDGRLVFSPLCLQGEKTEKHLVLECIKLYGKRTEYKLEEDKSLQFWIDKRKQ